MMTAQILIIDKVGTIGEPLSLKLSKEFSVVLVSESPKAHVSFPKRFPAIPDNKYSHIIVIDSEGETLEFLPKIIDKAKNVNSDLIFAYKLSSKENLADKVLSLYSSSKIVLYGDIFGKELIFKGTVFNSTINKFIYQALRFERIQVLGDGLSPAYPVFIDDVVNGIIDLVFGINDSRSLFYIFPKHPPSELSLAHMIQKAHPEISIDFVKRERKKEISFPSEGKYLLDEKYPLSKKIRAINIEKKESLEKGDIKINFKKKRRFPIFAVWLLIFLVFSPAIFTLIFSSLGLNTLYAGKTQIDRGNFSNAKRALHISQTFFSLAQKTSNILLVQAKIINREQNLKRLSEDIDFGNKVSYGLLQIFNAEPYFVKIINGKSQNPAEDFSKGQGFLKSAIVSLENLKAEGKISFPFLQKLSIIDPLIKLISSTSDVLPILFGMEGPRTYLVLFQNNMELRPTGGFIGSYGILKINMGKISEFSIHDVYDADGQLKGHVEPPFAIRRYLPSAHWYLRDSNFDVDFRRSASSSSNFLLVEKGEKADAVIAIDVTFVKNMLRSIGPVEIPDYKEKVDANNLYILTQSHAEKNFFPSSTQKKDFLRSLYKAMMAKISSENISYLSLLEDLSNSLREKHLIFAFEGNIQKIFTVNGWSGTLFDERKDDEKSVNDFLGINEANLGINKVNYFIKRNMEQKVAIAGDGRISEELDISYKNDSLSWPGGIYKNYLRIILPLNTALLEISINGISQKIIDAIVDPLLYEAKNFKAPEGLEVEKVNQDNKTIYGFLINVGVSEIVKVKIKYELEDNTADLNTFSYSLKLFKQPGIDDLPYSFSLVYPNNLDVISISEGVKKEEGKAVYKEKILEDKNIIINFSKK